jgi:hypothetical protein
MTWLGEQDYGERPADWQGVDQSPGNDEREDPDDFGGEAHPS